VVAFHGSAGLFAYDLEGKELWKRDLGKFEHIWGFGGSPILVGDLVLLTTGPGTRAFLIAFDKNSGETRWEKSYPGMVSKKADEFRGAWSTPVIVKEQGRALALFSLPGMLVALDPQTGDEVWHCTGLTELQYTSPVVGGDLIVATSGYGGSALAVERGGQGDVTETKRLWLHTDRKEIPQRIGSGVIVDGYLYVINEPGILWCMDPRTGEKLWEERLGRNSWASLCYVDGRIYNVDWAGTTFVIEPNPEKLVLLSKNPADGMTRATLAFAPGKVVQRTWEKLYCFGEATSVEGKSK
jgi:outer membrane protein assembly factor BamB